MSILDLDKGSVIVYPPANDTFLTVFTLTCSTLGVALSAVALVLLVLTAVFFVEWRQNYKNQLLIQFMIARFLYTGVRYSSDVIRAFDLNSNTETFNQLTATKLLYSEMALVSWMFFFSKQMYGSLVKVFDVERRSILRVSLSAWLLPALLAALLVGVLSIRSSKALWSYVIYLICVKWPVLVANAIFLILCLKSVISTNRSNIESNSRIVVVIITLIFVFCVQQVIIDIVFFVCLALLISNNDLPVPLSISLVIFNVLMLYQCVFSTLFWLFGNTHTRKLWRNWCKDVFSKNNTVANRNSMK